MDDQNPTVTVTRLPAPLSAAAPGDPDPGPPAVVVEEYEVEGCRPGFTIFAPGVPKVGGEHPVYPGYRCVRIPSNVQVGPRTHRVTAEYERG